MFCKSLLSTAALVLALSSQAFAHMALSPELGVAGTPVRNDVQRPKTGAECGTTNIAATIDTSTAVAAAADGSFTVTAINFNAGTDGSTQVTGSVDATGVGKTFTPITITTNGVLSPAAAGSTKIVAQLPAGTTCTGGKAGNLCLVSFVSAGNFGNCVLVSQGAAAAGGAAAAVATTAAATVATDTTAATTAAAAAVTSAAATTGTTAATGKKGGKKGAKGAKAKGAKAAAGGAAGAQVAAAKGAKGAHKAAGTRAARALLSELEARGEATVEFAKRSVFNWVWA